MRISFLLNTPQQTCLLLLLFSLLYFEVWGQTWWCSGLRLKGPEVVPGIKPRSTGLCQLPCGKAGALTPVLSLRPLFLGPNYYPGCPQPSLPQTPINSGWCSLHVGNRLTTLVWVVFSLSFFFYFPVNSSSFSLEPKMATLRLYTII